jgi:hypothetical protein
LADARFVLAKRERRPHLRLPIRGTQGRITKPVIDKTTRAGVERGELVRIASPGGQQGFKVGTVELENRWGGWRREP